MTLQNLLETGQLKQHEPTREKVRTLLDAVRRNLADAQVTAVSLEMRFDAAYKAVMQLSLRGVEAGVHEPDLLGAAHLQGDTPRSRRQ